MIFKQNCSDFPSGFKFFRKKGGYDFPPLKLIVIKLFQWKNYLILIDEGAAMMPKLLPNTFEERLWIMEPKPSES